MKFDSLDLAYNFYNRYAFLAGFGIRLHSSFRGTNKKEILRKEFVCCKQGAYRKDETRERKRQRGISRCNCKAKIVVVKTNGSKKYAISLFAEGHNHKMTASERVHLLRSHRRISDSAKVLTKQLGSVNIPIHQKADASSRRAYRLYGDVVAFDTTFNTNRYDLTFAPILGVNNHGQTIVLACTFLSKETTESFIWMFEEFKKAMQGGEPKTIITDQDAAITRAISIAFPTTFHRLCIWHITSKFHVKLPHSAYKEYWREFQKAIWDTDNKDEFDAKWNIVVTKAGLTDHQWLSSMFDLRESWVPAYARDFFAAGMSSSQRAEDPGLLIKRSTMSRLASDVVEDALMCEEGCELVSETLKSLRVKLKLLKDGPSNNEVGGSSSQTQYMKDPKRVRCKGKTSPSNNEESTPIDLSDPLFDEFYRMHGPTE
ncbi:hypothetical protein ACE6H2_026236 [Prunus campanulata]